MSSTAEEREDASTLLDRMEHIAEEEEEDIEEDLSIGDDDSMDPDVIFGAGEADSDEEDDEFAVGDYDDEEFDGEVAQMEYHWAPTNEESSESASYGSDFQFSGLSFDEMTPQSSGIFDIASSHSAAESSHQVAGKRGSFGAPRRGSHSRYSFGSAKSAPTTSSEPPVDVQAQRRVTMSVVEDNPPAPRLPRQQSKRRQSVSLKSMSIVGATQPQTVVESEENSSSTSSSILSATSSSILSAGRSRLSRKSTRRTSFQTLSVAGSKQGAFDSMDSAINTLGQGGNSEWENVAAAAAVVAGTAGSGMRSHVQFAVGDKVLVFLNILNHTNSTDTDDAFTVNPVNKFGYPRGEGKTSGEQRGPYVYVLATVKKVHFDEDLRYYTVARADSGAEQRADTAWMEPVKSIAAVEAATRAAQQTSRSEFENDTSEKEDKRSRISAILEWPVKFLRNTVVPLIRSARASAKHQIALVLYGSNPYSCKLRATGINLLVLCSFMYLFLDTISLAFFPSVSDCTVAVIGTFVWSILAAELLMEWLIRPVDYFDLIQSEKAYAPSTARNINSFHLVFEFIALALFIPEFVCLQGSTCDQAVPFSGAWISLRAVLGPGRGDSAIGRFCLGLRTFRLFGLARHWKNMWINNTFHDEAGRQRLWNLFFSDNERPKFSRRRKSKVDDEGNAEDLESLKSNYDESTEEDQRLKKAATIGTALMVINSHRALFLLSVITIVLPMIGSIGGVNSLSEQMTGMLQELSIEAMDCEHLRLATHSWLQGVAIVLTPSLIDSQKTYVLWAQITPTRGCAFLNETQGVITRCTQEEAVNISGLCDVWGDAAPVHPDDASPAYFAKRLNIREGGITELTRNVTGAISGDFPGVAQGDITNFTVRVLFNQNDTISFVNMSSFLLLLSILGLCLLGLAVLRGDAGRLVLNPLRRMLKIVVRYAENPLSQTAGRKLRYKRKTSKDPENGDGDEYSDSEKDGDKEQLGNYETEQLISAISKIADLLRKCWGVAGAGIISSNLARTQDGKTVVFNPTVPGKQVYALFGFVTINGFSDQLRALDRDVMILINDVAAVVHDEVYRWALGDSGQCNKNLGSSFLMVFRIGDFKEVHEKQARATDVVFSSNEKRTKKSPSSLRRRGKQISHGNGRGQGTRSRLAKRDRARGGNTLQLASLPGIQAFSDRALLGMLKSFAGIHRDRELSKWKRDFRLGAGVGAFVVNIIIGMDAGWAVEGAVGSEYKIDATYLSPHVNMAARMMSATKQYGVTILLSQAVEELLSGTARSKLRHLDTVYVKGSSVSQRIFTYDARHRGVDFFLFERSPEQADMDAESYHPLIWENDQDLSAMRQHVTEEFSRKFKEGKDLYLAGDWKEALELLREADDIMITNVLEEGYIDYNPDDIDGRIFDRHNTTEEIVRIRTELGDGACKCLIAYMEKRNGIPPENWKGVRPLTSK